MKKQAIHQDKHLELKKKTIAEGNSIIKYFENKLADLETVQEIGDNKINCIVY